MGLQAPVVSLPFEAFAQESDPQVEQKAEEKAPDGKDGVKGVDGEDGSAGQDGESGDEGQPTEQQPAQDGENGENGDPGESGEAGGEEDGQNGGDATNGQIGGDGEDGAGGAEGEDGQDSPADQEESSEGDTVVETGDATSVGQIQNTGNTNVVAGNDPLIAQDEELPPLCSDKTRKDEGKEGKESKAEEEEGGEEEVRCIEEDESGGDTEVENQNAATVANTADIQADTGDNEASGNNGSSTIDTGDATAILDVFNLVNTNIIDSNGLIVLLSNLKKQLLDFDLRKWAPFMDGYNGSCGDGCYRFGDLEIQTKNDGSISNSIVVRANTGGNEASGNAGDATIETGDAYAAANVINFANTNIVNSNYLLFIANNFGSFMGDIVFPNSSSFFSSLFSAPAQVYDETTIENTNNAAISNTVEVGAEAGGNEANGNGTSIIQTGDSSAAANIFNQANVNLFGGNSFVALIRVSGDWSGNVFGLPEGISWSQTPDGIMLYSDDMNIGGMSSLSEPPPCEECTEESEGEKAGKGSKAEHSELSVENTNNATITNDIQVFALTGDNQANGNGKGSSIQTGKAQAVANVVNIANTNVIGKNWLFAIFNILGDFKGNISFGRPDLWIGSRAEIVNDPALPGDEITYYLTIANNGDAVARNVQIKSVFDDLLFSAGSAEGSSTIREGEVTWDLGTLLPGEGREVSFSGSVRTDIPFGIHPFVNTSSVGATESDNNAADNTDIVELAVFHEDPSSGSDSENGGSGSGEEGNTSDNGGNGGDTGSNGGNAGGGNGVTGGNSAQSSGSSAPSASSKQTPNLWVRKSFAGEGIVQAGDSVDYTVVVTNTNGSSAYDAVLVDTLKDGEGDVVHEEVWDLGEIFPDEGIFVTYTVVFQERAESGLYINNARVEASNAISNTAQVGISVEGQEASIIPPLALGESAPLLSFMDEDAKVLGTEESSEESTSASTQPLVSGRERQPFLASLAESARGYSGWLAALGAASILLLLLLLGRKKLGGQ